MLCLPRSAGKAQSLLHELASRLASSYCVQTNVDGLIADRLDAVAECASHVAVRDYGPAILSSGCDLIVISAGALADDNTSAMLRHSAQEGASRIVFPAGAIGGVDALAASRLSGIDELVYTGRKPPQAWRGSRAAGLLKLDALSEPTILFDGTARQACLDYPLNANVASTLALAGIGLDKTRVRLIADPTIAENIHEFWVRANCGCFSIKIENKPIPANKRTSQIAAYSVARELLNRAGIISI
jgi:aspartate dehydrogenase